MKRFALAAALLCSPAFASDPRTVQIINRRVEKQHSTAAQALKAAGLTPAQVESIVSALEGVFDWRLVRAGDQFRVVTANGVLQSFDYRQTAADEWQVRRDGERYVGAKRHLEIERQIDFVELKVESSLYESALAAGEDPQIALMLSEVFAWDIDFYQDVRKGDVARAVVEKYVASGQVLRYGEVLAADYRGVAVGHKRVLRYQPESGVATYYEPDGSSARKAFLKSPLKFAHVTSGFGSRFHPILKYVKDHNGVDYAADIGTPVWAVGDGTVTRASWDETSGKHVCLKHVNQLETCYLHLSRYGTGVRVGARVQQKQVIGYAGNSGRSTGPHLHFALKRAGEFVNPLRQTYPKADPIARSEMRAFRAQTAAAEKQLDSPPAAPASAAASP